MTQNCYQQGTYIGIFLAVLLPLTSEVETGQHWHEEGCRLTRPYNQHTHGQHTWPRTVVKTRQLQPTRQVKFRGGQRFKLIDHRCYLEETGEHFSILGGPEIPSQDQSTTDVFCTMKIPLKLLEKFFW